MNFLKLAYFVKAATYSNLSMAAQECHIAQTAMSRHIADIENEIGIKLFIRYPKKVVLTPAGEVFRQEIEKILKMYGEAVAKTREVDSGSEGRLNLAFGFFERTLMIEYVMHFLETHPRISVSIQQYPYDRLLHELMVGNVDVAFCPPNWAMKLENIRTVELRSNVNCLALGKNNPLAKCKEIGAAELDGQTFILPGYESPFSAFSNLCNLCGFTPKNVVTVNTLEAMISAVETNVGIAFVPSYIVDDYKNVEFRPFNYSMFANKNHVAVCLEPIEKPAAELLLMEIAEQVRKEKKG